MPVYRTVLAICLLVLAHRSCSAPTAVSTQRITGEEKTTQSSNTKTLSPSSNKETTTIPQNTDESTAKPTPTASVQITKKVTTSKAMVAQHSTKKPMLAGQNGTIAANMTMQGNGSSKYMNTSGNSNVTNTTEVVEDIGPSSILYPKCSNYLGIMNRKIINDSQMFASTTLNADELMNIINSTLEELENDSNETSTSVKSNFTITGNKTAAHDGRLGNTEGSWCASGNSSDGEHHLIVDIGKVTILEGVVTQGRSDSDNWVTKYSVSYSSDSKTWVQVKNGRELLVFKGNKDRNSMVVGSFPHRIATRYLKFTPKSFHGKWMCMRVEAVGCHPDDVNVAKNQPVKESSSEHNVTSSPKVVDGIFISRHPNETCTRGDLQSSPWLRIDLRRTYYVKEIFISNQDHRNGYDMWDFEVRVGNSLENEGNDNEECSPLTTLLPGQIGTIVCKNVTLGRYVNIRIDRDNARLSLCEVAVIGIADEIVKLGLEDIALKLKTGSVSDKKGEATAFVGGLLGELQQFSQGGRLGAGILNELKGSAVGMLGNLGGQGKAMLNNMKEQGLQMANKLKNKGMEIANKAKEQAMGMANKMKEQGMEMANKVKGQAMEAANKAKGQAMEAANKAKGQAMEAANKAKGQAMEAANQLQGQGQKMMGDVQGQVGAQQDKFKKKLKEFLDKGKEYLKVGKKEMDKFKKSGYIETGKEYLDIGLGMTMDGIAFIQGKLMESLSNIAGDMTKQITTLSEYDTSNVKGLLDDVDPVPVRNFVEEAKPKVGEFIDDMQTLANKYFEIGVEKAQEARDEIEKEADSAQKQATGLGKNVASKATNVANKAKNVGMKAVNKAKDAGMKAVNKAKDAGMKAVDKAKSAAKDAVNKAKEVGLGALDKAKSLGQGMLGDLQKTGMGMLGQVKGLGMSTLNQFKGNLKGIQQNMMKTLSKTGQELLSKAKKMKPGQLHEMKQIQTLQQLKKAEQMKKLQQQFELEQNEQWEQFEQLNKEMEDRIKSEEMKLEGANDAFKDNDVPTVGGTM